jgi:hypothetical protein
MYVDASRPITTINSTIVAIRAAVSRRRVDRSFGTEGVSIM